MRGRGGVAQGRGGAGAGRRDAAAERRGGSEHRLVAGEEDSQKKGIFLEYAVLQFCIRGLLAWTRFWPVKNGKKRIQGPLLVLYGAEK